MSFYLDTSVFGGYYDPEFSEDTVKFFEEIVANKFDIVRSSLLDEEIGNAPPRVREVINKIPIEPIEYVRVDQEAIKLASAYVEAGVLSKNFEDDAIHIALATINRVDTLVS